MRINFLVFVLLGPVSMKLQTNGKITFSITFSGLIHTKNHNCKDDCKDNNVRIQTDNKDTEILQSWVQRIQPC